MMRGPVTIDLSKPLESVEASGLGTGKANAFIVPGPIDSKHHPAERGELREGGIVGIFQVDVVELTAADIEFVRPPGGPVTAGESCAGGL